MRGSVYRCSMAYMRLHVRIVYTTITVYLFIMLFYTVIIELQVSTMWPYLQSIGGSRAFLGGVVASFSVGQLVGAPFWGKAEHFECMR